MISIEWFTLQAVFLRLKAELESHRLMEKKEHTLEEELKKNTHHG
jgi:hypothetical protein